MSGQSSPPADRRLFWPGLALPGSLWLAIFFVVPAYTIACVAFGQVDPIFRDAVPVWNPLQWQFSDASEVLGSVVGGPLRSVFLRTSFYVIAAIALCLIIGYPIAYYLARQEGVRRTILLALMVIPFWVSFLMRLLAWVNLLEPEGLASRFLRLFGIDQQWLNGNHLTVILGLVYGYLPFLILPLYASLERLDWRLIEAARDLGASSSQAFRRITLPLSRAGIAAGTVLIALPMFGDYYTNDLLSRSPRTEMIGNQIDFFVNASSQKQKGATLVLVLALFLALVMSWYLIRLARVRREAS